MAAANFAVGHAVGRAEVLDAAANSTALRDDSTVLPNGAVVVDTSPTTEARFVLHIAHDAFEDFLPALLWLSLIVLLTLLVTWALTKTCGYLLRQCGSPENWSRFTQYALAAILLLYGMMLAFGAVGVNFWQLSFGLSIVTSGIIISVSGDVQNLFAGLKLASFNVLSSHRSISVPSQNVTGQLIVLGVFISEVLPDDGDGGKVDDTETILIENRLLLVGPLRVRWRRARASDRPPAFTSNAGESALEAGGYYNAEYAGSRFPVANDGGAAATLTRRTAVAAAATTTALTPPHGNTPESSRERAKAALLSTYTSQGGGLPANRRGGGGSSLVSKLGSATSMTLAERVAASRHRV